MAEDTNTPEAGAGQEAQQQLPPLFNANVGTPEERASIIEFEQQSCSVAEINMSVFCMRFAMLAVVSGGRHFIFL